jgi:hypothetical protein
MRASHLLSRAFCDSSVADAAKPLSPGSRAMDGRRERSALVNRALMLPGNLNVSANAKLKRLV